MAEPDPALTAAAAPVESREPGRSDADREDAAEAMRHMLRFLVCGGMFIAGCVILSLVGLPQSALPAALVAYTMILLLGAALHGLHSYLATGARPVLSAVWAVMTRELRAYFTSPIAVVVFVIFHVVAIALTLQGFGFGGQTSGFWERGYADMEPFFGVLPWLMLFVVPALSMRLWAEERQIGSIELLLTLPITRNQALIGKFLGAWLIVAWMLFLPAISMLFLLLRVGSPDVGQIVASFIGAVLMGGAYLALGSFLSALTRDQIVAFILTVVAAGAISLMGSEQALDSISSIGGGTHTAMEDTQRVQVGSDSFGALLAQTAQRVSLASRFRSIGRGVLDLADLLYYVGFIAFFLYLNSIVLAFKRN
ncbi:MAG: ABC transporter permease subunit [Planctomycetota bacterium]